MQLNGINIPFGIHTPSYKAKGTSGAEVVGHSSASSAPIGLKYESTPWNSLEISYKYHQYRKCTHNATILVRSLHLIFMKTSKLAENMCWEINMYYFFSKTSFSTNSKLATDRRKMWFSCGVCCCPSLPQVEGVDKF
jgi:hypothetical protein